MRNSPKMPHGSEGIEGKGEGQGRGEVRVEVTGTGEEKLGKSA